MRIIFMGYHNIGYACLEALIEMCGGCGDEIVAVVTHADDPTGKYLVRLGAGPGL